MPRHRGKSSSKKGAVWSARRAKVDRELRLVGGRLPHVVPCGNVACESCRPLLLKQWRDKLSGAYVAPKKVKVKKAKVKKTVVKAVEVTRDTTEV